MSNVRKRCIYGRRRMIFVIELGVIDRFFNGFKELRQCRRLFIADRKFRSKWNRSQTPHSFLLSNDIFNVPLYFYNLNKSSPLYIFIRKYLVGISGYYNLCTIFLTYRSLRNHNIYNEHKCLYIGTIPCTLALTLWTLDYNNDVEFQS